MRRRNFIKKTAASSAMLIAAPLIIIKASAKDNMDRIGLTTVVFRNRFKATCPKDMELKNELTLMTTPEFFVDRFGVKNIEVWTKHFESTDPAYINDFKYKMKKSKCKLIDIQAEGKYDVSDPDEENRQKGIAEMKSWIDVCQILNSEFVRIRSMNKSYKNGVDSIRVLNEYAKPKGVKILIENHNDLFSDSNNHVGIYKEIDDENVGLLADFGNYKDDIDRYTALMKIAPFTRLISAKAKDFNEKMEHVSYDFAKCVNIFKNAGYQGIYSCEQWGKANPNYDYEKITDWMIGKIKEHI